MGSVGYWNRLVLNMKLNISYPASGSQKLFEFHDEAKVRPFFGHRMSQEVTGDSLGDEWKGYVFRVCGGNDKQGFPMKQGVLTTGRVRLLLSMEHSCYRSRRTGERKRKSVRGCIVDSNLSVLALAIVKKGEAEISGLTDKSLPKRLGPKRASKIRKLFNLGPADDVRKYVVRSVKQAKEGKEAKAKAPKIQRLITPQVIQRKRPRAALKVRCMEKARAAESEHKKLLAKRAKEQKDKRAEAHKKRRLSSSRASQSQSVSSQ